MFICYSYYIAFFTDPIERRLLDESLYAFEVTDCYLAFLMLRHIPWNLSKSSLSWDPDYELYIY